jgi:hypothetical protein
LTHDFLFPRLPGLHDFKNVPSFRATWSSKALPYAFSKVPKPEIGLLDHNVTVWQKVNVTTESKI